MGSCLTIPAPPPVFIFLKLVSKHFLTERYSTMTLWSRDGQRESCKPPEIIYSQQLSLSTDPTSKGSTNCGSNIFVTSRVCH